MKIKNSSQAKQILLERAAQMAQAFNDGAQAIARLGNKGSKLIEVQVQKVTGGEAEKLLGNM